MRIYSSLWDAEDWATRGGLVKTNWNGAPFTASYRNFNADACVWSSGASSCRSEKLKTRSSLNATWLNQELDFTSQERMKWVQKNYMIYNYCTDLKRFPQGLPPECSTVWRVECQQKRLQHIYIYMLLDSLILLLYLVLILTTLESKINYHILYILWQKSGWSSIDAWIDWDQPVQVITS